jgi:hypothetical protein
MAYPRDDACSFPSLPVASGKFRAGIYNVPARLSRRAQFHQGVRRGQTFEAQSVGRLPYLRSSFQ